MELLIMVAIISTLISLSVLLVMAVWFLFWLQRVGC